MGQVVQKKNPYFVGPSQTITTVTVEPEETTKTTTLGAPDVRTQEYVQRNVIDPLRRAYGVNPQTGAITPFEALGYNPEEERKRREAERALNDRNRKENAWYNAFAVLGDSLTAALGGNVWQRQPNNIGAQANADNARLIAEQKAEDEGNAAKLRAAGLGYTNTVNKLIQNYLTKTTITNKTGGSRTEVTNDTGESGYRYSSHVVGDDSNRNGSGGGRGKDSWNDNADYEIGLLHNGKLIYHKIKGSQAKNIVNHAETLYEKALQYGDEGTKRAILELLGSNIVQEDPSTPGKYDWDDEALLRSGYIFEADKVLSKGILTGVDKSIRDYYREITGDNTNYDELPVYDMVTPAMQAIRNSQQTIRTTGSQGRITKSNPNDRAGRR